MIIGAATGFIQHWTHGQPEWFYRDTLWWDAIGYFGNFLFSMRFILQWLQSERHKRVVVPPIFWHLSFWGSIVALIYGFHMDKLPLILSYLFLPILYARNLKLLKRNNGETSQSAQDEIGKASESTVPPSAG